MEELAGERIGLRVQYDRRPALLIQRHVLRAMLARRMEPCFGEALRKTRRAGRIVGELDELEARMRGRRRRREKRLTVLRAGALQPGLLFEIQQRAVAIGGRGGCRRGAKTVVENFERERALITRREH